MEYHADKPHNKLRSQTKPTGEKSPTRLQKRAPKSLQLDIVANADPFLSTSSSSSSFSNSAVIPFLSPVIMTPPPLPTEEATPLQSNERKDAVQPSGGWQHPAVVVGLPEPSSLYNVFKSKCVLMHTL